MKKNVLSNMKKAYDNIYNKYKLNINSYNA